ncbi:DUF2288 domain-containing protein [Teredinibacter purpureus]|uniref:DUF2288 domain-containing protein n=1 Tax=Teredinibacter purpureus TaxID=2731756 RepID=UPI0005F7906E|nr:DUF2288 domain-containing protein [Teredinibacter purpureus]
MLDTTDPDVLKAKLNSETATIPWRELQRFFAAGHAIAVAPSIDLLSVATAFNQDDATQIKAWMNSHEVQPVTDEEASLWYENDTLVWAVVVSPWVLVQAR